MKRISLVVLSMLLVISLFACSSKKQLTKEEVLELFENKFGSDCEVVECFIADDLAYGSVGVVLFTSSSDVSVALLNSEGQCSVCSTKAQLASSPAPNYDGNGVITYIIQSDDGLEYEQKITFKQSRDWDSSSFDIDDNYFEVLAEKQANDRKAN